MRAWRFQDYRQKQRLGDKCPWSVGWYDDGKRRSKKVGCLSLAGKFLRKKEGDLAAGICPSGPQRVTWKRFRQEWEDQIAATMLPQTRGIAMKALVHFERIVNPGKVRSIKTQTIDAYKAKRRKEQGKLPGKDSSNPSTHFSNHNILCSPQCCQHCRLCLLAACDGLTEALHWNRRKCLIYKTLAEWRNR